MLQVNLRRAFAEKGITDPLNFLRKLGFTNYLSSRILRNTHALVNLAYVEKICIALKCTPNDILSWYPGENSTVPQNHPLHKLKPAADDSVAQKISNLPFEKMEKLSHYLDELNE